MFQSGVDWETYHFLRFPTKEETTATPRQYAMLRCHDADDTGRPAGGAMFGQRQNSYHFS